MCAAISVIEDEGFDDVPITERYALRYLNERPVKELLYDGHDEFLQFFVKHNLPQDDLYDILRAFNTADDLALLRRLVFLSKSDGNSFAEVKWRQFCENLLFDAVKDENEALLEMLLDVGVDANARGHSRQFHDSTATFKAFNALQIAILGGNKNVIDILNSCCARIFTGSPVVDSDFLSGAFTRNTIDFAKPQLASEATWHSKPGGKGLDILVHAVEQSYDNIVDILFEAGFNPYSRADRGDFATGWVPRDSAFMVSLRTSKTRYLGKFLTFPYHALDRKRRQERLRQLTAGYVTARCTENVALGKAILDAGWRPDHVKLAMGYDYVQEYLHNALEQAVERGYCEEVRCLLQMGANPNLLSYTYVSGSIIRPLHSAIEEGNVAIVRQLVEARADVNVLSSRSNLTPLQKAVYGSSLEIVSILVEAGANVNSTTRKWSRSAVEIAADKGNLEMVTYLLESGANVQGRHNHNYRRTLYWAQNHGHNSVVDLLQDWKRSRHGEQDCDAIGNIMSSTTEEELDLLSRVYD
ncbi:uncharacterized protein J4E87_004447 [Alternaria ethzedia]|uniref:uncharacterized protein n=1 Tax=Alternaria ethzedia TaxID=181014 RepID=UPI0020C1F247|nr:uncharacterized protein J4E87_004447 [Alternaria ethzedia]KAI4627105.1 hypothetical protein J4E87_004447 [Alternaria ethzedia]